MSAIKKNTITIFLASSDELINDRNSFQALISSLDDIYESRGIRVKCKRWEDFVAYCTGERTQDDYNKVLSNSDICICMFHRKAGTYTVEEFNHSMEEYKRTKDHPKTYVYARAIVDGEIEEEELKQFKADLFKKMGHYWCNYQTDDAMKLHFIMQFERLLNSDSDRLGQTSANIKVENGNVLLHGRKIADYSNLPFASANSELQMLKDQVAELDKEIATLSALGIDALLPTINEKKSKRYDTNEQIKQLENQLLEMALSINKMISSGEPISERKRMAIEMFEVGNTKGVLEVLNEKDIASDIEDSRVRRDNALRLAQSYQEEAEFETRKIRSLIEEYILKAKNCMSVYSDSDRLSKACALYEKAIESTRQNLSEEDLAEQLFNYAYFLQDHNQFHLVESFYVESLDIYECLSQANPEAYEPDLAQSLNNLAILYNYIQRFDDSETYHLRAIEIIERLSQANPEAYEPDLAMSLNNLGNLYSDTQRFDDSETYYLRALEIRERLSQAHPEAYELDLSMSLNNLGCLYYDTQRFSDSEAYLLRAIEIRERLSQANPEAYEPYLAGSLNNLGDLYRATQRFVDSETYHLRALDIYERLSQANPEAYEPDLAMSLNNLGVLYRDTHRFDDSETYFLRALEIYERLSQTHPEAYEPDLAMSLNNLGALYSDIQRFDDSETYYLRAIEIRERLSQANPEAYEPDLAISLNCLAILYRDIQRFDDSETYHLRALDIYERLSQTNPEAYEPGLAISLNCLGALYSDTQRFSEAETYYLRALEIYERLFKQEPNVYYLKNIVRILNSLSYVLLFSNKYSDSEEYAQKALSISPEYLMPYTNLAASILLQGRYDEAKEIYLKYKDELKNSFLDDFEEFKLNGVIPQERLNDVEKIITLLND